jgi:Na+/proline symporter
MKHWTPRRTMLLWIVAWLISSVFCFGSLNAMQVAEPESCKNMDSRQQAARIALISIIPVANIIIAVGPTGFCEYGLNFRPAKCLP